ncbi:MULTISPECIES: tyrosine-type recombinase/integrase [Methanosarcina]|nr:tyrosine-type recombinase/integrase [Methanosarcina mazei]
MDMDSFLDEYLQRLEDDGLSKRTIDNNIFILKPFIKWLDGREVTDKTVMEYLRYLKPRNYTDSTLYQYRAILKKFLSTFSPEQARNIKLKVKRKEPPIILTQAEIEQLIEACRNPRDKALISFLYESGCRKGELVSIRLENVTFTEFGATVTIPKGKTGSRTIPVVYSASYLRQWVESHPTKGGCDPLFCSLQEPFAQFSFSGLSHLMRTLKGRTGIKKDLYPHLFRHSRASHLANQFTEQQLKQYLGWTAGSNMAAVYVHLSQRDIQDAVLKAYGIELQTEDKNKFKVGRCPRCKEINPESSRYCGKCGMPLKDESIRQLETESDSFETEFAKLIAKYPNIIEQLYTNKNED